MYVCACACVLFTLPLEWSGRNKVLFTLPVKQCYFPPPRECWNLSVRSYVRGAWGGGGGGGGGGWYINDCARACMQACVCVHELVHKLRYDGINEVYNHICLSFPSGHCTYNVRTLYVQLVQCTYNVRTLYVQCPLGPYFNIYLSIYAHIRTHTHIHTFMCVCVWVLSH